MYAGSDSEACLRPSERTDKEASFMLVFWGVFFHSKQIGFAFFVSASL